ncbi:beta-ketoacyl-[acyl-carrier-protein] synthase family protein [Kitasatospora gansuensis]|uniref:beta-ketoacyl-[acyl-carrier-protein] synthase family protein n=1 Tax=Kitasatospora gansuensis TaxID=258050 RepID=UPI0016222CED|nr:beta-ketoacyl-[acyl-carrier-protein] synthase family protein [Kitasatospora gansuensis]
MRGAVVVTGTGLVTPGGIGTDATWSSVCGGRSAARPDPELVGLPVAISCRVPGFAPDTVPVRQPWRYDRSTLLLLAAAHEAMADAGLSSGSWDGTRVALVVGSAAGGIGTLETQHRRLLSGGPTNVSPLTLTGYLPNMAAGHVALELGIRGPSLQTSTACASGATAVITAALLLAAGQCDLAVACGTDAMVTPLCAAAFAKMGALSRRDRDPARASRPFDRDRDGFVLAEGAGVLILERAEHAAARRIRPHATLAGYATTSDAHHATAPDPRGTGLRRAVTTALGAADATLTEVDHINAHGTGTPLNDRAEATTIRELFTRHTPTVTSAKGCLGHTMGAAGAIEAVLTVASIVRQTVPPTANFTAPDDHTDQIDVVAGSARPQQIDLALSHSLGFGGHNTVLAFTR